MLTAARATPAGIISTQDAATRDVIFARGRAVALPAVTIASVTGSPDPRLDVAALLLQIGRDLVCRLGQLLSGNRVVAALLTHGLHERFVEPRPKDVFHLWLVRGVRLGHRVVDSVGD